MKYRGWMDSPGIDPRAVTRRDFFKMAAVYAAALALGGCSQKITPNPPTPDMATQATASDSSALVKAEPARTPVILPNTETWIIDSKIVAQAYKIFVSFPGDYDTSGKTYPVLYLLDANAQFGMALAIVSELVSEKRLPTLLTIGIGYPTDDRGQINSLRMRDFTPSYYTPTGNPNYPAQNDSGHALQFLSFLQDELKPEINQRYRIQASEAALVGHSLGGLFGLFALFHKPALFNRFVVGSPSIWWDGKTILADEQAYAAENHSLPAHVYMGVGKEEGSMVADMEDLARILGDRDYSGLDLKTEVFDQEAHASVIPLMMSRGLRAVYKAGDWN